MKTMWCRRWAIGLMVLGILLPGAAMAKPLQEWNQKAAFYQERYTSVQSLYDYVLPVSNQRIVTYEDLVNLSPQELSLARNEIYARHGYIFQAAEYARYFEVQSWYKKRLDFSEMLLSQVEKANAAFLMRVEQQEAARLRLVGAGLSGKRPFREGDVVQISEDVNADGVKETIRMRLIRGEGHASGMEVMLSVGERQMRITGQRFQEDSLYLMDFVQDDNLLTIGIVDYGTLDNEEKIMLFRYDGRQLIRLEGVLPIHPKRLRLDGKGYARAQVYHGMLATTTQLAEYKLADNRIQPVLSDWTIVNLFALTRRALPLKSAMAEDAQGFTVPIGQRVLLRRIHTEGWVEVLTPSGRIGWMRPLLADDDAKRYEPQLQGRPLLDYLDGLIYAG